MNFAKLQIGQKEWRRAGQQLIEMAIAEFLYEEMMSVTKIAPRTYQLAFKDQVYQFKGDQYLLGHWKIDAGSVREILTDQQDDPDLNIEPAWNLHAFIQAFATYADVKPFTQAYLMKEMNNTWLAEAHVMLEQRLPSKAVLTEPHYKIEGMLRGHPWLIMSKGRMGFGYDDYLTSAPEVSPQVKVLWLAVHRDLATFRATEDWQASHLYAHELSASERNHFENILLQRGLSSADYFLIPVHAWQWHQWLVATYAHEIVAQRIIELDIGQDQYVPMQSIRTLCNVSQPKRHYVKLPVSILNTAVYRGLPSKRNLAAPALTAWLKQIQQQDPNLKASGVEFLGEVATLTIQQPCYDQIEGAPYQFKELFGCLWRESVDPCIGSGQSALSQAALLHRDTNGQSILKVLIDASGLTPLQWLKRFAEVSVQPLLICLYKYGLAFSPHGENTMLIHRHGLPEKLVLKDFIDDVNLVDEDFTELADLPEEANILLRHSALELSHFIFTGLFMVHYRYICNVFLQDFAEHSELEFWQTISEVIEEFHQAHPEWAERIEKFAIFRPEYDKICLNRVRLFTTSYNDEAERPVPVFLDPIANPVSPHTLQDWVIRQSTLIASSESKFQKQQHATS